MSDKAIRTMTGMVVSCNSDKTAVAKIDRKVKHPKLGKIIRRYVSEILFKKLFYIMLLLMSGIILINGVL